MSANTMRALLLSSASALTIAAFGAHAATVTIPGGGASLPSQDYAGPNVVNSAIPTAPAEEFSFDSANAAYLFQYFYASSGRGQAAFSGDSPAAFQYTGKTPLPKHVDYAASDAFLAGTSGTTVNGYTYTTVAGIPGLTADYPGRATRDGALIQLPMLGVGIAIPALSGNGAVKANGTLHLTDSDLCGIFSGKITDYSKISNPLSGVSGAIHVYYRGDSSGTSFLFTNHLHVVCNATNSNFPAAGLAAVPSTTFTNIFTGGTIPKGFTAETGSAAIAVALAGAVKPTTKGDPAGIAYLSTDFTAISANGLANKIAGPSGGFINTAALFDAGVQGFTDKTGAPVFLTPSVGNVSLGLANPGKGSTFPRPPARAAATNPLNWVPSIPRVIEGYPIVGYTTWELAQCYNNANIASGLRAFLLARFSGNYNSVINANGFTLPAATYNTAIKATFLNASSALGINTARIGGCKAATGRL